MSVRQPRWNLQDINTVGGVKVGSPTFPLLCLSQPWLRKMVSHFPFSLPSEKIYKNGGNEEIYVEKMTKEEKRFLTSRQKEK